MNILFVSLGCDKNVVDAEEMLGKLRGEEFSFTDDPALADIIIVNTCCFINDAKEESINTILEMAEYKKYGKCKGLIVCGCLAQRYKDEVTKEIPEVDALFGTSSIDKVTDAVMEVLGGKKFRKFDPLEKQQSFNSERVITTGGFYGYLKIAEGCDKRCTYCIIPEIRGRYRSFPMDGLVKQAEYMAANGVKEIILVAQETTLYGVDLYGEKSLHLLLRRLSGIKGIKWIRILYSYPEEIYDELIYEMRDNPTVCKYLDMPIQHISDRVLKRMGRRTDGQSIKRIIDRLRREIPEIILRTTLISGFPGETDNDHNLLKEFLQNIKFDRLGVFEYSQEENTPAAAMSDQTPENVKSLRRNELMEIQQAVAFDSAEKKINDIFEVIIEGRLVDEDVYIGRTYMDAPGVDGNIFVAADKELLSGDLVRVKVTGAHGYDLIGVLLED